jgi:hypothetical protein
LSVMAWDGIRRADLGSIGWHVVVWHVVSRQFSFVY